MFMVVKVKLLLDLAFASSLLRVQACGPFQILSQLGRHRVTHHGRIVLYNHLFIGGGGVY